MPFAAVIAELYEPAASVGWELVGAPATGKSTGLMLAASVMGGAADRETSCIISMSATANGLERVVPGFNSTLIILEEGQLYSAGETPAARARNWREIGHRLTNGSSKLRGRPADSDDDTATTATRLWFLLNSNEPTAQILGGDTDADLAALQRIRTLPAHGRYGRWNSLPKGVMGGAAFSDSMQAAVRRHHGTPIRAFLQGYVT